MYEVRTGIYTLALRRHVPQDQAGSDGETAVATKRSTHLNGTINRLIHEEADGSHQVSDDDEVTPALPVHAQQYKCTSPVRRRKKRSDAHRPLRTVLE